MTTILGREAVHGWGNVRPLLGNESPRWGNGRPRWGNGSTLLLMVVDLGWARGTQLKRLTHWTEVKSITANIWYKHTSENEEIAKSTFQPTKENVVAKENI